MPASVNLIKKENTMEQKPTIQDVTDQLEQMLVKIILAVLSQLKNKIAALTDEDKIKF
jgi:hypothetical protein